jgi:hypothetical protein
MSDVNGAQAPPGGDSRPLRLTVSRMMLPSAVGLRQRDAVGQLNAADQEHGPRSVRHLSWWQTQGSDGDYARIFRWAARDGVIPGQVGFVLC